MARSLFFVKGVACETLLICCHKENIKDIHVYTITSIGTVESMTVELKDKMYIFCWPFQFA